MNIKEAIQALEDAREQFNRAANNKARILSVYMAVKNHD